MIKNLNMIDKSFTGHLYYNSACESDSDCGNCDGGNCDYCSIIYKVDDKHFSTLKEAEEYQEQFNILLSIPEDKNYSAYCPDFVYMDGSLYARVYDDDNYNYIFIKCNPNSSLYNEFFEESLEAYKRKCECTIADKNVEYYGNCCATCNCREKDSYCYELMLKGNTEKIC